MDVTCLTRQDIITFPFPYKLWIVVQLDFCSFIRWNPDGTILLLDLAGLEDYLNSARSIFKIKNRSSFLQHMEEFQFERLNASPEAGEDILMQYKHVHFQRHRLDLVAKIRRPFHQSQNQGFSHYNSNCDATDELDTMQTLSPQIYSKCETGSNSKGEHMVGDLCFKFHSYVSKIQASRMLLQSIVSFQNETRILQEKLRICDEKVMQKRRFKGESVNSSTKSNCPTNATDDEPLIDLSAELFENPYDSLSNFGNNSRTEYAGYYGNCTTEQIINFFGDYLPRCEEGTTEFRKIVVCPSVISQCASLDDEHDVNVNTIVNTDNYSNNNIPNKDCLMPIGVMQNNNEIIESSIGIPAAAATCTVTNSTITNTTTIMDTDENIQFTEMSNDVEMDTTDSNASTQGGKMRSFFDEYRASLNLLNEDY